MALAAVSRRKVTQFISVLLFGATPGSTSRRRVAGLDDAHRVIDQHIDLV
jgi:hypothetical protein